MDLVTRNPGFQHISEEIFLNLDQTCLMCCQKVNQIWGKIINNPTFWLKKCVKMGLLKQYHSAWTKLIQESKESKIDQDIKSFLMKMHAESNAHDTQADRKASGTGSPPDMTANAMAAEDAAATPKADYSPIHAAFIHGKGHPTEFIRFAAPILNNPNSPFPFFALAKNKSSGLFENLTELGHEIWTPIQLIAYSNISAEIIGILAPLTENPNAPDADGWTPINRAARNGNSEIINILAPFTDDPNAPDPHGWTPINRAAADGRTEILKILAPLTKNPNAPEPLWPS